VHPIDGRIARRPVRRLRGGRRLGRGVLAGRWPRRASLAALLAVLWLMTAGMPAGAHALLRESDPAAGSSLDQAPRRVVLTFTERPEPGLTSIQVLDTGGQPVQQGEGAPVEGEPLQFAVGLGDLADGTYTVSWRVVSRDDGHVTAGSFAFGVGVPAPAATAEAQSAPQGATESPSAAATAARLALYAGLTMLVGVAVTGLAVTGRVLPSGARVLLAVAVTLTVAGGVARFLAEQARIDAPLGTLLDSSTGQGLLRLAVGVVATAAATWFLVAALRHPGSRDPALAADTPDPALAADVREPALRTGAREPALAVAGPPEGEPSPRPDRGSPDVHNPLDPGPVDTWRLVVVGVAAGTTMLLHVLVGHAAGPSSLRSVNLLVQWLHLLAVGAWIGGLVWLLAGLRGRERPEQLASAVRFSKLAAPVLGLVAVTGLSRALHLAGGWRGLIDSPYGRFLDLKVALFLGLVLLGALNRFRVVPALADGVRRLDGLRRNVRGEVVLAACILAVTAVLSQLPPGKFVVEQASAKPQAPPSVQDRPHRLAGHRRPEQLHRQGHRLRLRRGLAGHPGHSAVHAKGPAGHRRLDPRPDQGRRRSLARPGQPALDRRALGRGRPGRGVGPGGHRAHGAGGPRRPAAGQGLRGARPADPLHHHPVRRRHPPGLHRPRPPWPQHRPLHLLQLQRRRAAHRQGTRQDDQGGRRS
jgi:copper transport protein